MNKQRLSSSELQLISKLILSGMSLNKISKHLNKSKYTIYYHFRKIKGRTFNSIIVNEFNEELVGEFIGLFAGDGSFYKTNDYKYRVRLHFGSQDQKYVDNLVRNVLIPLFNKKPMQFVEENRLNLCYNSRSIYEFIQRYLIWDNVIKKTYTVKLKPNNYSKSFHIGFVRGNLDSDGHFSKNKISFATVSSNLKEDLIFSLNKLGLAHSVRYYVDKRANRVGIYHIDVPRKEFSKFITLIKPRNMRG